MNVNFLSFFGDFKDHKCSYLVSCHASYLPQFLRIINNNSQSADANDLSSMGHNLYVSENVNVLKAKGNVSLYPHLVY